MPELRILKTAPAPYLPSPAKARRRARNKPSTLPPPAWAISLTEQVARIYGREPPEVSWRRSRPRVFKLPDGTTDYVTASQQSTGHYKFSLKRITITAGTDDTDQRLVLLHELAHWINDYRAQRTKGHNKRFWLIAFRLYAQFHVPLDYARERECAYRRGAQKGYDALYAMSSASISPSQRVLPSAVCPRCGKRVTLRKDYRWMINGGVLSPFVKHRFGAGYRACPSGVPDEATIDVPSAQARGETNNG